MDEAYGTTVELELLELICSRLCHDLVGPVGAINNGVELLGDLGSEGAEEIMPLIESSARLSWRRLDFFRAAFGYGGIKGGRTPADLRCWLAGLLEEGKVALEWPEAESDQTLELPGRAGKLLLNTALIAAEAMPRGGTLGVRLSSGASACFWSLDARGRGAAPPERVRAVLDGAVDIADLDARTAQPYLTLRLVEALGARLDVSFEDDHFRLAVECPN